MNEDKKKAHSAVGAAKQAAGSNLGGQVPASDYTTPMTELRDLFRENRSINQILPTGKEHAIPGHDLMVMLGLRDLRDLTQLVERERKNGFPICASTSGGKVYYVAATPDELEQYSQSLSRRIHNMGRTMTHLEATLTKMAGQEAIDGW